MFIVDGLSFDVLIALFVLVALAASWVVTDLVTAFLRENRTERRGLIIKRIGKVIGNEKD